MHAVYIAAILSRRYTARFPAVILILLCYVQIERHLNGETTKDTVSYIVVVFW